MAYAYAKKSRSHARSARWTAVAVVLFPLSLTHVDFRAGFGRGVVVRAHHASPAFAALEDLNVDFGRPTSGSPLPELVDRKAIAAKAEARHLRLAGLTIHLPAEHKEDVLIARIEAPVRTAPPAPAPPAEPHRPRELASVPPEVTEAADGALHAADLLAAATPSPIELARAEFRPHLAAIQPGAPRALWLDGQIEMTGGLAWVGPETGLVIKRTVGGRTLETGRIWVTEGRFEIHVAKPTGLLVAELQGRDGRVLGRGEIPLGVLNGSGEGGRVGDLRIALRPTTEVAAVRALSGYSHDGQMIAMNQARVEIEATAQEMSVDDEGYASEPTLGRDSTFVARASAPKHWPTVIIGQANDPQDVRLLSNVMVDALLDLNLKGGAKRAAQAEAVVWGRVTKAGRPVAGARVELTGGQEPIYFNEAYLPDSGLRETGANGLYAFVDVKPGTQALRVRHGDKAYPAQVFDGRARHVSYVEMALEDFAATEFRVSDVLESHRAVPSELRLVGTDATVAIPGAETIALPRAGTTTMIEADAGPEFEVSRTTLAAGQSKLEVPVVRRAWLRGLYASRGVNLGQDRGTVVGFVDGQDFEVEMTGALLRERLPVVYFDGQGRPLETATGVAGGGFAILNAPSGVQTVHILPLHSRTGFSQVVVAEPSLVQVMTWSPPR